MNVTISDSDLFKTRLVHSKKYSVRTSLRRPSNFQSFGLPIRPALHEKLSEKEMCRIQTLGEG